MIVIREQPTVFLLRALRVYSQETPRRLPARIGILPHRCRGYLCRCPTAVLGWDYPDFGAIVDSAMDRAGRALSYVAQAPGAMYSQAAGWARGELLAAQADLNRAATAATDAGLRNAGSIINELSTRVSAAWVSLGQGAGQALHAFLGFQPSDVGASLWWLVLAGMGLAAVVAFSPSGAAIAGGMGRAYGSIGAGVGEGIAGYGRGIGQLLASPEKLAFLLGAA